MENPRSRFLTRQEVAAYCGLTDWWFDKHAHTGRGPRFIRRGRKAFYDKDDVDLWLAGPYGAEAKSKGAYETPTDDELEAAYEEQYGAQNAAARRVELTMAKLTAEEKGALYALVKALRGA